MAKYYQHSTICNCYFPYLYGPPKLDSILVVQRLTYELTTTNSATTRLQNLKIMVKQPLITSINVPALKTPEKHKKYSYSNLKTQLVKLSPQCFHYL